MPLRDSTLVRISQWFMESGHGPLAQLADRRAQINRARSEQNCHGWAIRGLSERGANIQNLLHQISMGGRPQGLEGVADEIHNVFGRLINGERYENGKVKAGYDAQTRAARDKLRPKLHQLTAAVFEYCLRSNGFQLADQSDYCVCMEYDCESDVSMYPNFTHAWLAYRDAFVVQKVTGRYVSISMREAGRSEMAGIIRRPVVDFLPEQLGAIEEMVANPMRAKISNVTQCFYPIQADKDAYSPNECLPGVAGGVPALAPSAAT